MNLEFTVEQQAFREQVRTWLTETLPPEFAAKVRHGRVLNKTEQEQWHALLNSQGWLAPHWPVEYGGTGWDPVQLYIFNEEMAAADAPRVVPFAYKMLAPVLFKFGNDSQRAHWLPRMLNGDDWWCQGYSEPGSGSDLASLKTSAVRRGDHYIVNGQKTWTSYAQNANMIFCLVRTSTDGKPQEGISFLLIDMASPGVEVRPIQLVDGSHEVNEVWFTDVKVPVENLVGEENQGWTTAKFLLAYERSNIGGAASPKRELEKLRSIAATQRRGGKPLSQDPLFAARLAKAEIKIQTMEVTAMRVLSAVAGGDMPMSESSILKIIGSELIQEMDDLTRRAAGRYALPFEPGLLDKESNTSLPGPDFADTAASLYHNHRKVTIYGGSTEVQKNIIAKVSGL